MTDNPLQPGFMVIHSNRPESLRQLVVAWMKAHPLRPLEDEIILVQSNGVAQWLKQALASDVADNEFEGGCGIAAALNITLPSRFVWQTYRNVLGKERIPESSPFDKGQLIWRLMRLLPRLTEAAGYEPLQRFLRRDDDLRKRYQLAERLADLFDQYQVYRADWLAAWARGQNVMLDYHGGATPLAQEQAWQPMLWRALQEDVGTASATSRASVHRRFLETAADLAVGPKKLPRRVIVFGLSSLPRQSLEVLQAIARWTQVILCVNNPCEYYWANIMTEKDYFRGRGRHRLKPDMPEHPREEELHLHAHPLLAGWGKQGRDYIALLDEMDDPGRYRQLFDDNRQRIDLFESHGDACLLNQLQDDIRELRSASESRSLWQAIEPTHDHSIRFHRCHSPQREVEVLHDRLLAAFDADPTLKPREIIVMVPEINQYAPHIQAVFGQIDPADARYIPYSIADLGQRQQAPLAFALECLLNIGESRLAVSEVLDLLNVPALRRRFGLEESDLPLLQQWIVQANIRWGLNAEHRRSLGIDFAGENEQNTWLFGLKRMLLGYAVGSDPSGREANDWHDIEPYGDVAGLDAALVGPLAQLLNRLEALLQTHSKPATPTEWTERLQQLLLDFFEAGDNDDSYLLLQLQTSLEQWLEACRDAGLTEALPLSIVRDFWLSQIDQGGLSQRFFAGSLTFATLMPMRAIPFRRIYLLGMNDGDYPRILPAMDFDLMAKDYRPGDRSRREDDRYLFLEALLSAREHLHISWVGRSIHDNSERPPSVLVGQLRDHIADCWSLINEHGDAEEKKPILKALTVEHPLQPFSQAYFDHSSPLFTYAREWRPAARAEIAPIAETELPPSLFDAPVQLPQLLAFMKDPVKTFLRERLGVFYECDDLAAEDQEPFAIDALSQWLMQDELIRTRLDAKQRGESETAAVQRQLDRLRRQGVLPIGVHSQLWQTQLAGPLDQLFELYDEACRTWPEATEDEDIFFTHEIEGQGIELEGRLTHMFTNGQRQRCRIEINSSNLIDGQKYRRDKLIPAWVQHLAGHLHGQPLTTCLIGKNGRVILNPLEPALAKQHFIDLLHAYVAGLRYPLPITIKTGFGWLTQNGERFSGPLEQCQADKAVAAARNTYEGGYSPGELARNPYLQRCYPSFEALWAQGEFTLWSERLLKPLWDNVGQKAGNTKGKGARP